MPKEIITNGRYVEGDNWAEVGWARGMDCQIGVRSTEDVGEGLFCDLDRESINKLIRTLRKARDQAFGADA